MICLQKSAKEVNMVYASITFDMSAATNAYKILWNQYEGFQNVVTHLNEFHFISKLLALILININTFPLQHLSRAPYN